MATVVTFKRSRKLIESGYVIRNRQALVASPVLGKDYMPWTHSVERWHAA